MSAKSPYNELIVIHKFFHVKREKVDAQYIVKSFKQKKKSYYLEFQTWKQVKSDDKKNAETQTFTGTLNKKNKN